MGSGLRQRLGGKERRLLLLRNELLGDGGRREAERLHVAHELLEVCAFAVRAAL